MQLFFLIEPGPYFILNPDIFFRRGTRALREEGAFCFVDIFKRH